MEQDQKVRPKSDYDYAAWVIVGLMVLVLIGRFFGNFESDLVKSLLDNATMFFVGLCILTVSRPPAAKWKASIGVLFMATAGISAAMSLESKLNMKIFTSETRRLTDQICYERFRASTATIFDRDQAALTPADVRVRLRKLDDTLGECLKITEKK